MKQINPIDIVIADPQYLTSKAIETILGERYTILTTVTSKSDFLEILNEKTPGLIILDITIYEELSSFEVKNMKEKVPNILIIANKLSSADLNELSEKGFETVCLKSTDEFDFNTAVESGLRGRKFYSEELLELIIDKKQKKGVQSENYHLTRTELEITRLIAEGLTTKQIAAKKFLSFHTVMTHRKNIFRKTGVKSVSELLMVAVKSGWIDNIEYYI